MRAILAMAGKDLRLLVRDRMGTFWVFGFPLVMAFLFGAMFSGAGGDHDEEGGGPANAIPVAVADAEGTDGSRAFVERLEGLDDIEVQSVPSRDAARDAVLGGKASAYIVLESGFGGPGPLAGDPPRAEIGVDPSRRVESGYLRGILMQAAAERMRASLEDAGMGGGKSWDPVTISAVEVTAHREPSGRVMPASAWEVTFPSSILWGLLACAATFAVSLVTERQAGTLFRLRVAPVTRTQVLAGKGLACFATCTAVATLLLAVADVFLGVRVQSPVGLAVAVGSTAACFVGIMMLLSVVARTEQAASGIGWGVLTVMAMLGGGMFPLFLMPPWMLTLSHVSPVKWGIVSIEGAIWRGFSPAEMAVPCAVLLGVGAACFAAGAALLARSER